VLRRLQRPDIMPLLHPGPVIPKAGGDGLPASHSITVDPTTADTMELARIPIIEAGTGGDQAERRSKGPHPDSLIARQEHTLQAGKHGPRLPRP